MECRYVISKSSKDYRPNTKSFSDIQIFKFNTLRLITAKETQRQHHINAITMYYDEYLIRYLNSMSEWDLILQLATLEQGALGF